MSKTSPRVCASALLEGLPVVMWYIRCKMRQHAGSSLSVPQYRALFYIDRSNEPSLSKVADHLGCALPTASRLISGLVRKKFIVRGTSSKDGRKQSLGTTPLGKKVLGGSVELTKQHLEEALQQLHTKDQQTVHDAMVMLKKLFSKKTVRKS